MNNIESLRLDKYLKVSRLIKRRTVAKDAADKERVMVNNLPAKPSKTVVVGDLITIAFGKKQITVKVLSLNQSSKKENSSLMYELIEEKSNENSTL